jgi:hypothetical protein
MDTILQFLAGPVALVVMIAAITATICWQALPELNVETGRMSGVIKGAGALAKVWLPLVVLALLFTGLRIALLS